MEPFALVSLSVGVFQDGAFHDFFLLHGNGLCIGVRQTDVVEVPCAYFRVVDIVQELHGQFFVLGSLGDGHVVGPDQGAFLGHAELDAGVVDVAERGVAAPHLGNPGFFRDHLLFVVFRIVGQYVGVQLLQLVEGSFHFLRVCAVVGFAHFLQGQAEYFPVVVQKDHVALVFGFPQVSPAGDGVLHILFVVGNAGNAPDVRNGIFLFRIVVRVLQAVDQAFNVRQLAPVQLFQHVQLDHGGDHVIGRLDDIELGSAGLHFC